MYINNPYTYKYVKHIKGEMLYASRYRTVPALLYARRAAGRKFRFSDFGENEKSEIVFGKVRYGTVPYSRFATESTLFRYTVVRYGTSTE